MVRQSRWRSPWITPWWQRHKSCWTNRAAVVELYCVVAVAVLLVWTVDSATPPQNLADAWYLSTRCNEVSTAASTECSNYERCKATHRCARGDEGALSVHSELRLALEPVGLKLGLFIWMLW